MTIKQFINKLALQYKQPYQIDSPEGVVMNPQLNSLLKWTDENFADGERLAKFFDYILRRFIPTTVCPCPMPAHLEEIKDEWINIQPNIYKPIDFDKANNIFGERNKIKNFPDDFDINNLYKILSDMEKDDEIISAENMFKKYGRYLCQHFWSKGVFDINKYIIQEGKK